MKIRSKYINDYEEPKKLRNTIVDEYDFVRNEKGELKIEKTGEYDFVEYVQSFKDETGLANILKLVARTGDTSLLNKKEGQYLDLSSMPTDELDISANENTIKKLTAQLQQQSEALKKLEEQMNKEKEQPNDEITE